MVFNLVVKESCLKHLQDIITMSVCDIAMLLSHNQPYFQCALRQVVYQWEKKFCLVLL